jgi:hypothetical protein
MGHTCAVSPVGVASLARIGPANFLAVHLNHDKHLLPLCHGNHKDIKLMVISFKIYLTRQICARHAYR